MIAVVDAQIGNIRSVERAFKSLGAEVVVAAEPDGLEGAEKIVLPGVGAFGVAMSHLRERGFVEALDDLVLQRGVPFLGICLGMQLICRDSTEHGEHEGLGWIPAGVRRIDPGEASLRVPHVGWNDVAARPGSVLLPEDADGSVFYFVHSFHVVPDAGQESRSAPPSPTARSWRPAWSAGT